MEELNRVMVSLEKRALFGLDHASRGHVSRYSLLRRRAAVFRARVLLQATVSVLGEVRVLRLDLDKYPPEPPELDLVVQETENLCTTCDLLPAAMETDQATRVLEQARLELQRLVSVLALAGETSGARAATRRLRALYESLSFPEGASPAGLSTRPPPMEPRKPVTAGAA